MPSSGSENRSNLKAALHRDMLQGSVNSARFAKRISPRALPELMDQPCSYEDLQACMRSLDRVNRWTLGYRSTLAFLDRVLAVHGVPSAAAPLRIVDIGSGGGDTLRRVARWARRRGVAVELTGLELNAMATRAAGEFTAEFLATGGEVAAANIRWVTGDVFNYAPAEGIDVVLSSLMLHHLEDEEIVRFFAWQEGSARLGWFVNDLERSAPGSFGFSVLADLLRLHRFTRHDGPVSFRRALREGDWQRLLERAGIAAPLVAIEHWRPARLCAARLRKVGPDRVQANAAQPQAT